MPIKKENKIMVIVAPSADDRELLISRLAVRLGYYLFCKSPIRCQKDNTQRYLFRRPGYCLFCAMQQL